MRGIFEYDEKYDDMFALNINCLVPENAYFFIPSGFIIQKMIYSLITQAD